jgi:hypothetical protein
MLDGPHARRSRTLTPCSERPTAPTRLFRPHQSTRLSPQGYANLTARSPHQQQNRHRPRRELARPLNTVRPTTA